MILPLKLVFSDPSNTGTFSLSLFLSLSLHPSFRFTHTISLHHHNHLFSFFISNRHNYTKESSRGFSVIFLFHRDTRVNRDTNVHKSATQSTLPSFFVYLDIIHITSVTRFGDFLSYWQKNSYKRT